MRVPQTLVLLCAAALLSVAAAPAGKARTRAGKARAADTTKVLVRFADGVLTDADLKKRLEEIPEQFRAQYSTPDGRKLLLDRMIEERVWLTAALQAGVADRPEVKAQLERSRRDLLVRTHVNEVMAANPAPSDSEMQAHYQEHLDDHRLPATVTVGHLLSKTENESKRIKSWLDRGQKWDDLVQRYSADTTTRRSGGRLGTVTREGLFPMIGSQPALAESAFALGVGRVGGPYKTSLGYHLLRVEHLVQDSIRPFETVRPMIQRQLTNKRQQDFYKERLAELRARLRVREDSAAIQSFLSARKSAREMFDEAQRVGAAAARIEAYRKVLEAYPDSEVSPQAQFMIGFVHSEELKEYGKAEEAFRGLLARYPKSELAASAQWMIDHMRSEEAPPFLGTDADSARHADRTPDKKP